MIISQWSLENYKDKDHKVFYSDAIVRCSHRGYFGDGCGRQLTIREFTAGVCCDKHKKNINGGKGPGSLIIFLSSLLIQKLIKKTKVLSWRKFLRSLKKQKPRKRNGR